MEERNEVSKGRNVPMADVDSGCTMKITVAHPLDADSSNKLTAQNDVNNVPITVTSDVAQTGPSKPVDSDRTMKITAAP